MKQLAFKRFSHLFPKTVGPSAASNHDDTGGSDAGDEHKRDAKTVSIRGGGRALVYLLQNDTLKICQQGTP